MPCGGSHALLKICENLILYCGKCWLLNSALSLTHNCCSSLLFINQQHLLIIGMYLLNSDWKNKILYSTPLNLMLLRSWGLCAIRSTYRLCDNKMNMLINFSLGSDCFCEIVQHMISWVLFLSRSLINTLYWNPFFY